MKRKITQIVVSSLLVVLILSVGACQVSVRIDEGASPGGAVVLTLINGLPDPAEISVNGQWHTAEPYNAVSIPVGTGSTIRVWMAGDYLPMTKDQVDMGTSYTLNDNRTFEIHAIWVGIVGMLAWVEIF